MDIKRSAGILLHPTSLPGRYGIGDLGDNAFRFIDFLVQAGQTLWQVFPLGPTGYGDSPYQCFSAFAGNPLLISPDILFEEGLLSKDDVDQVPQFEIHKIEYGELINYKTGLLKIAYKNFKENGTRFNRAFETFNKLNTDWLDDFALFMACKQYHGGVVWTEWDKEIAFRNEGAVDKWNEKLSDDVSYHKFIQFIFFKQWGKVKNYANASGIKIIGDLPIFIAYDSSDLWSNKELFSVDKDGKLENVAGVPPDYFSETGQLWGNPLYRWNEMEKDDFKWWQKRFSKLFEIVDIARIDHFRGFEAYWEIPGDAKTAIIGRWVKAPGDKLFTTIRKNLGDVPIIAEDLGVITDEVRNLRDKFNFPGIKILQFAFGEEGDKNFLPHNFPENCIAHSGSHDNDTTRGFFDNEKSSGSGVYEWTQKYLNYYGSDMTAEIIRTAYASVAKMVVIPMQDVLNLGTEARMNFPSRLGGNWQWRFSWDQLPNGIAGRYKEMAHLYERPPEEKENVEINVEDK